MGVRGNVLGPVDRTVSALIDRSYPVVKAVYFHLKEIELCAEHIEAIEFVSKHVDEIQKVQDAANALIRINESLDEVLEVQDNLDSIKSLYENLKAIQDIGDSIEGLKLLAQNIKALKAIYNDIEDLAALGENIDQLLEVYENIDSILQAVESAKHIHEYVALARAWATQTAAPVVDSLYGAKYYADKASKALKTILEKEEELKKLAAVWFTPSVSQEGIISWTNNGDLKNPDPVNIKGPKGDKGDQGERGWSYNPNYIGNTADRSKYDAEKKGASFLDIDTGLLYFKKSDKHGDWSEGYEFKGPTGPQGPSANEILMDPDPVAYFDEIYGISSGDIIGSIVVSPSPVKPDPTDTFEESLTNSGE